MEIETKDVAFILSIWGSLLATYLAIKTTLRDRTESIIHLFIDCREAKNSENRNLQFFVTNIRKRPVTIVRISFGIGADKDLQRVLLEFPVLPAIKLQESEIYKAEISKDKLVEKTRSFPREDFMYKLLWINIELSSGSNYSQSVFIDPRDYKISVNPKYDEYLATARFFGLDLIEDYNKIWTSKMKYVTR